MNLTRVEKRSGTVPNQEACQYQHLKRRELNVKGLTLSLSRTTGRSQFNSQMPGPYIISKPAGFSEFLALVMRRNIPLPPHIIDCSGTLFEKPRPSKRRPWETLPNPTRNEPQVAMPWEPLPNIKVPVPNSMYREPPKAKPGRKRTRARKLYTKKARREALQARRERRVAEAKG